jgi:hypothetical protein
VSAPRKDVGGRTFAFGTLPATKALDVIPALAVSVVEVLKKIGRHSLEKLTEEEASYLMAEAVMVLMSMPARDYVSPDGAQRMGSQTLFTMLFEHTTIILTTPAKPRLVNIDKDFTGKVRDMYLVAMEALKVNFADFFPAAPSVSSATEAPPDSSP